MSYLIKFEGNTYEISIDYLVSLDFNSGTTYYTIVSYTNVYQAFVKSKGAKLIWNEYCDQPSDELKKVIEKYIKHLVFA